MWGGLFVNSIILAITVKVVNTATSQVLLYASSTAESQDDIDQACKILSDKIAGKF